MIGHSIAKDRVKSLLYSIYDGFFYSLMVGFGESYFSAYALFLGANNFQMGILTCLPPFLAGLCQFFTTPLLKKYASRKKMVVTGVAGQALSLIPLMYLSSLNWGRIEFYIILITLYFATNQTVGPVWNSWMGDLVSPAKRGIYFGRRNQMVTIGTFLSITAGGLILRQAKEMNLELFGFVGVLFLAFLSRTVSFKFLTLKYDPPMILKAPPQFQFFQLLKTFNKKSYGTLILSMVTVNFGVYLAAAYFTPHLLKNLKVDYFTYTVLLSLVLLFKYLTSGFWGEVVDNLGAKKVVALSSLLICFTSLPWIFSSSLVIIALTQCYTGFVWAGYELSTFTLLLDLTEADERTPVTSFFNILNATMGFLGGMLGAIYVNSVSDSVFAFKTVFAGTVTIRLLSYFIFSRKLKDAKVLSQVKTADVLIKASGFKSTLGLTSRLIIFARRR